MSSKIEPSAQPSPTPSTPRKPILDRLPLFVRSPAYHLLACMLPAIYNYNSLVYPCKDIQASTIAGRINYLVLLSLHQPMYAELGLHFRLGFPRKLAYRCVGQALLAGFSLGALVLAIGGGEWDPWWYLDVVMAVTWLVLVANDFCFLGLWRKGFPISAFFQRRQD
ncbi:hypothetical protein Q7P37_008402 [Cladosporium fusiforme]